jgi:solute carrier family 30 (zinc transporter), member 2
MTDAAHLLSDVSGFGVAIFAAYTVTLKSSSSHTFGYHRVEVLGALISVLSTWLVTGILVYEAVYRILNPVKVDGKCKLT